MVLVVTVVGFLIHVYSIGYMGHDPGYARYMAYLNLFMFAMLTLVLGANYLVLFVGWEGVGLCSYLLIGFWFEKQSASDAGKKAFIVNRIGDAGFLVGVFLIFVTFGTLDFRAVMAAAAHMPVEYAWGGTFTLIGLLLFVGATGKSAQFPLYVWLPDAMEGPTPVSALIHAATMVTAGVYMVARSSAIYAHAPKACWSSAPRRAPFTAIFAASHRPRPERHQAGAGVLDGEPARLHVPGLRGGGLRGRRSSTSAPTRSSRRSSSSAPAPSSTRCRREQDMRQMGGLRSKLPWTHLTMLVGCIAIAGIPPLAGFFSKDEILWSAYKVGGYGQWVWGVGVVAAAMTAFYMFRLYWMTFGGTFRGTDEQAHHLHESPRSMVVPLQVLAAGSAVGRLPGRARGSARAQLDRALPRTRPSSTPTTRSRRSSPRRCRVTGWSSA